MMPDTLSLCICSPFLFMPINQTFIMNMKENKMDALQWPPPTSLQLSFGGLPRFNIYLV